MKKVNIHLARINKPTRHFKDGFIDDNGRRLLTRTKIPPSISTAWSKEWQKENRIPLGQVIGSVSKYLFYDQFFSIMEIQSTTNDLLGYYVDISTPVRKEGDEYYLDDLILDFWIYPNLTYLILDEVEWQQAVKEGLISEELQGKVRSTLNRLQVEIHSGEFPRRYIRG